MANIKVELSYEIVDGQPLTFKAPCNCSQITGIKVEYPNGENTAFQVFSFADAHGNDLTGIGNLFAEGAVVKVILDTTENKAFIQNADTNAYLEDRFLQLDNAAGIKHPTHPGCYTRSVDGEIEWLNPPMEEGVEYRTAERHNGLPVYAKRVVFTEMPAAGEFKAVYIFPVEYRPISISGVLSCETAGLNSFTYDQAFPVVNATDGAIMAVLEIRPFHYSTFPNRYTDTELVLRSLSDLGNATADCTVKYIKG